eukprot:jgi/Astpho2/4222/Aster-x1207
MAAFAPSGALEIVLADGALPDPLVPHSQQLGHHTATDLIQKLQETLQDEEDCRLWFKQRTPTLLSGRQKAMGVIKSWPWFPDGLAMFNSMAVEEGEPTTSMLLSQHQLADAPGST